MTAEELLNNAQKLKDAQETIINVRRNMTEEERAKMRELPTEVREKNGARSEDDEKFFWGK